MNVWIKNIQWDTEGHTLAECELPANILMINIPEEFFALEMWNKPQADELLFPAISEAFGFNLDTGAEYQEVSLSEMTRFMPDRLAVVHCPF